MPKFRKRPVIVDAVQWWPPFDPRRRDTILCVRDIDPAPSRDDPAHGAYVEYGEIDTLEGTMRVSPSDWIIKGVAGEFYPCKPAIFDATYEEVTDG